MPVHPLKAFAHTVESFGALKVLNTLFPLKLEATVVALGALIVLSVDAIPEKVLLILAELSIVTVLIGFPE